MGVPAIRLEGLTKYHGAVVGIEDLSLDVEPGEVFGFLGANGAGKTTTIRTVLDLLRPTRGSAAVMGFDCQRQSFESRRRIGYLPGEMPVYPELTGAEYLRFLSALGPQPPASRTEWLLRRFNVSDLDLRRRMRDYSQGMKRKLGVVQALMTGAPVLILDEPTSGLDPLMIEAFAETIHEISRTGGATVFLSSHILSEVDRMCSRIGIVRAGRLVAVRTLAELRASAPRRVTVVFSTPVGNSQPLPQGAVRVSCEPQRWIVDITGPLGPLLATLAVLPVHDIGVAPFTVQDTVLRLYEEGTC
ncbi:MAG TPA: ABC transporter ATP-binding protein [Vicinamibacterales bacterium]|nr:ABC transporter ATP-binding protein [Vicinamibacterales bacterium]